MAVEAQFRCDVSGPEALASLRDAALPPRLRGGAPSRSFHRDIYLDTNDRALLARGVSCRVRIRTALSGLLRREPRFAFLYDACTVRHAGLTRTFEELQVRRLSPGAPRLEAVAQALERQHGLRPMLLPRHVRAAQLVEVMAAEGAARMLSSQTAVVLLALDEDRVAFLDQEGGHMLPVARGSGEEAVRHLLRYVTGSGVGTLFLLSSLPATEDRDALEVWVARKIRENGESAPTRLRWVEVAEAVGKIGTPEIRAPETLAALAVATRANLLALPLRDSGERPSAAPRPATDRKSTRLNSSHG